MTHSELDTRDKNFELHSLAQYVGQWLSLDFTIMSETYPAPKGGASLVLSFRMQKKVVLILGSGSLAAFRAFACLEADSFVIILAKGGPSSACDELRWRAQQNQVSFVDWDTLPAAEDDSVTLNQFLSKAPRISLAMVTDTVAIGNRRSYLSAQKLYEVFKSHHIPVNMPDMPDLCDFSFTSTHRFEHHETGEKTPLQIGVTTNGYGCRLASRLRREIVTKLPREIGAAVEKVGKMRNMALTNGDDQVEKADSTLEEGNCKVYSLNNSC